MWQAIIPAVSSILERVLPNPRAAADAKLKLLELAQKGELAQLDADVKTAIGQMEVNKAEAQTGSLFIGGWRPAVGWVCVAGMAYQFIGAPLLTWVSTANDLPAPPVLDMGDLLTILAGMLGLGSLRTVEKFKGVAKP
jgi:hypothetical protein